GRFRQQRVDTLGRDPRDSGGGCGVEGEQGGREWSPLPRARPHCRLVGLLLGELVVAIAEGAQCRQEEQRLAQDSRACESQWVASGAVMVLVEQHRPELLLAEKLERSPRDVDGRTQISGAEGLRGRVV